MMKHMKKTLQDFLSHLLIFIYYMLLLLLNTNLKINGECLVYNSSLKYAKKKYIKLIRKKDQHILLLVSSSGLFPKYSDNDKYN